MTGCRIATLAATAALALTALVAPAASATYHENLITEVHQGPGAPTVATGDFVELQAYAPGQNLVGSRVVQTLDGGGAPQSQFTIPSNVANGANQATILVANDASTVGADFITGDFNVVNTNGGACFLDTALSTGLDCVTWGGFAGATSSPAGTPLTLPGATIPNNGSISRTIARGCATALDAADDTNNSNADFALATPSPRGNATAPTETVCPTPAKAKKCKKKKAKKRSVAAAGKKKKGCKKKKKKKK